MIQRVSGIDVSVTVSVTVSASVSVTVSAFFARPHNAEDTPGIRQSGRLGRAIGPLPHRSHYERLDR